MKLGKSYKGLIQPGDIIKHEKYVDTAIFVTGVGVLEVGATSIQIIGEYMNQGFTRSWFLGHGAHVEIKVEDLPRWYLCTDEKKDPSLRKCDWIPLGYL